MSTVPSPLPTIRDPVGTLYTRAIGAARSLVSFAINRPKRAEANLEPGELEAIRSALPS